VSFAQERLWFLHQVEPENPAYNLSLAIRLTGVPNIAVLQQSLNDILQRHEALRTTFAAVQGYPVQIIAPSLILTLPVVELREFPECERHAAFQQLRTEVAQWPFDLEKGPLVHVKLLRLAAEEHVLFLTMHHMVCDAWSMREFFRELVTLYAAFSTGQSSPLPPLPLQYADFVHWQRQWIQGERLEAQLAYWKQQLNGAPPVLELPTARARPVVQTAQGARQLFVLPRSLSEALKEISQQEGTTLCTTLLAAFKTLLYRYTDQEDIVVGMLTMNRTRAEFDGLIGCCANTVLIRTDLSGDPSFQELLRRVRDVMLGAQRYQELPFELLLQALQPRPDLSHAPLFQVGFMFQDAPIEPVCLRGLTMSLLEFDDATTTGDVSLSIVDTGHELCGALTYDANLFDAPTITCMLGHFQTLLTSIIAHPEQRLAALPVLAEAEQQQVLVAWNDTRGEYPTQMCIPALFEAQVKQTPEAIAVVCEEERRTYQELNLQTNQVAHYLQQLGVGPEVLVGVCMERSFDLIVAVLGIFKAGGCYVPLDPTYPRERLAFMMADTQVTVVLTQEQLRRGLPAHPARVVCLDADWEDIAHASQENLESQVTADHLAYVMYTSGSTGRPKGVAVEQKQLLNRFAWMWRVYPFAADEVCSFKTSVNFVDALWELFGGLLQGIQTVIIPERVLKDPQELVQTLAEQRVTRIMLVPSLLQLLLDTFPDLQNRLPCLKIWCTGGEALSGALCRRFMDSMPHSRLVNIYGLTEAFDVTAYDTKQHDTGHANVPIGRPIANMHVYLLDSHMHPVPIGVPGEIYIGGVGLARGYLNQPALTAEKFLPHPFSDEPGARLYKTGDLARYLSDGTIECLGRTDHQVKIRGFRIELGEIEAVLSQHPAVRQNVVIAREDVSGDVRLVAYVVPAATPVPTRSALYNFLKQGLPDYMVPTAYILLKAFPLTPSGKVNRRMLPAPEGLHQALDASYLEPRDDLERTIATVWREVLRVDRVGIHDNFFDLGGHSFLILQVKNKLRDLLGRDIAILQMYQHPTIRSLVHYVRRTQDEPPVRSTSHKRAATRRALIQQRRQVRQKKQP
jgi:amino acid adenylation domain-containing protein